ncbi:Transaldolase [hydrothermal vent metagenome]|uniref:Transaldolase n=1 Tax=hydrothermal vent metagenome TaxID=652676 RepID=A0A3B0S091_9ZZZZ
MKFFLDTAIVDEVAEMIDTGLVDGVTTNPSLIAKSGKGMQDTIAAICKLVDGPVSAEVTATNWQDMVKEGVYLRSIAENVCVKVPLTLDGLRATHRLSQDGHPVNVTLCFSANQALLAAKAGATFVSPFIGRLDDIGIDGMDLITDIRMIFDNYPELETEILAASIRSTEHMRAAALIGADVATLPAKVMKDMVKHPLTTSGLDAFLADWKATGQSILQE